MFRNNNPENTPAELNEMLADSGVNEVSPAGLSGLSLAFIGDAVYEVFARSLVLGKGDAKVKTLHSRVTELVNASFQAKASDRLTAVLSEDELTVFKRGRNAHSAHTPKNKTEAEYHKSTGFEALIGYLWLKKDFARLAEILRLVTEEGA